MISGYVSGSGLFHRAHPLTAIAVAIAVVFLVFLLPPWQGPVVVAAVVLLLALAERVPRMLLTAAVMAVPFWFFLLLIHVVIGEAPERAIVLGARMTAMVLVFLTVLSAVHPARLIDALVQRGVPFSFSYLFAATIHAVPRLRTRARTILEAQRCRGLRVSGPIWQRMRALLPLAFPLVLGALNEIHERTVALEIRAAGATNRRTPLEPPPDSLADRSIRWLMLMLVVGAATWRLVR